MSDYSQAIKVIVHCGDGIPDDVQAKAMFDFEVNLRKLSGLDIRVLKERMGDDSKLRVMTDMRRK
jgi:hypothetical protein